MKLTAIIVLVCVTQTYANVFSQDKKIIFEKEQATIHEIFNKIESQSEFKFLFHDELINLQQVVSLSSKTEKIFQVLDEIFKNSNVSYKVLENNLIVIIPSSQQLKVNGKVYAADTNEPLAGVNIIYEGTTIGTTSDANGGYTIAVPDGKGRLVFTFIGYLSETVEVSGRSEINIGLSPDLQELEEVVVVGYGTQKKKDLTSAISVVEADELKKSPVASWATALQGKSAGVEVQGNQGRPGSGGTIRIRGVGSINSTSPLIVVDGVPMGSGTVIPSDIASMQILKDAAACAIYGSRGANGVILITTRAGQRGAPKVSINSYMGFEEPWKQMDLINSKEWAQLVTDVNTNAGKPVPDKASWIISGDPRYDGTETDWQSALFQQGIIQEHTVSVSGGTENGNYYVSAGMFDQEGIMVDTRYKRYNFRVNSTWGSKKFKFGENIGFRYYNDEDEDASGGRSHIEEMLKETGPVKIYEPTNIGGYGGPKPEDGHDASNPIGYAYRVNSKNYNRLLSGAFWGEYEILKGLKYRLNFGFSSTESNNRNWQLKSNLGPKSISQTSLSENHNWDYDLAIENTLTYQTNFGDHDITAMAGYTAEEGKVHSFNASGKDIQSEELHVLGLTETEPIVGGSERGYSIQSILGRVIYAYKDKYLFTANVRRDGSSKFGAGNRYAVFPSASLGWRLSEENFMDWWTSLSNLKLRSSYGAIGSQSGISDYQFANYVKNGATYAFNNVVAPGVAPRSFGNPDIKWETVKQFDIGFDLGLFNGDVEVVFDYYNKKTEDMLIGVSVPASSGTVNSIAMNAGSVQNSGIEFSTTYHKKIGSFEFEVTGNISTIKNEVLKLTTQGSSITAGSVEFGSCTRTEAGHPVGAFYGYKTLGVFPDQAAIDAYNKNGVLIQSTAKPGDIKFADLNDDGKLTDADRYYMGSPIPDIIYGLNFNMGWKGLDASFFFQGVQGNEIYAELVAWTEGMHNNFNATKNVLNRWKAPDNINTNIPRAVRDDPNQNIKRISDRYIKDGSYLRMKSFIVGYTLPKRWTETVKMSNVRFYFTGRNLLTFTKYPFYDPEIGSNAIGAGGSENTSRGIDNGYYPQARTYTLGVQVDF